jgi:hypothetical protein
VTGPLRMADTDFHVPADKVARFAANYTRLTREPENLRDR